MKTNPCYQCTEREVGCHSKCEAYITWKTYKCSVNPKNGDSYAVYDVRHGIHDRFKRFDSSFSYKKKKKKQ